MSERLSPCASCGTYRERSRVRRCPACARGPARKPSRVPVALERAAVADVAPVERLSFDLRWWARP